MPRPKCPRDPNSAEEQDLFLRFVRQVSPEADPTSIGLFGQVMQVRNLLTQAAERDLASVGLSWAEFRLLMNLLRQEHCSLDGGLLPSELSNLQGLSPNTVSALINSLEGAGLIRRELHPTDRRKFVIHLTPDGRQTLESQLSAHLKHLSDFFEGLSPEERLALHDLLSRLTSSLKGRAEKCKSEQGA